MLVKMATSEYVLELNKLKKEFLVEIILNRKVPIGLNLSENLRKHLEDEAEVIDRESITSNLELLPNENVRLMEYKHKIEILEIQLSAQGRLIVELERTINNQQLVIDLVKQNNIQIKNSSDNKNRSYRDVAVSSKGAEDLRPPSKPKKSVEHLTISNEAGQKMLSSNNLVEPKQIIQEERAQNYEEGWHVAQNKKKRNRITCIGTSKEKNSSLNAVPREVSLHVYRLDPKTEGSDLKGYLKNYFPEVECTLMKSKYPEKYASFKVTVAEENFKKAMDPAIWPYGTCVQRFLYLRERISSKD